MNQTASFNVETLRSTLQLACILDDLKTRIRTGWEIWQASPFQASRKRVGALSQLSSARKFILPDLSGARAD